MGFMLSAKRTLANLIFFFFICFTFSSYAEEDCLKILTAPEDILLANSILGINQNFLRSKTDQSDREEGILRLLRELNPNNDQEKSAELNAFITIYNQLNVSSFVLDILMDRIHGQPIPPEVYVRIGEIEKLSIAEIEALIQREVEAIKPYVEELENHSIHYTKEYGWVFNRAKIYIDDLKNPRFKTALALFISPAFAVQVGNDERIEAIKAGNFVFLPVEKRGSRAGNIPILAEESYKQLVDGELKKIDVEIHNYLAASKAAGSYWNLMKGAWWRTYYSGSGLILDAELDDGVGSDDGGYTPYELEKMAAFDNLELLRDNLIKTYGVPEELRRDLYKLSTALLRRDKEHINEGIATINSVEFMVYTLPLVALPFGGAAAIGDKLIRGGYIAASVGSRLATASKFMFYFPPALGFGLAAGSAGVDSWKHGTNFFCSLKEALVRTGAPSLAMGNILGALPSLFAVTGAGIGVAWHGLPVVTTAADGAVTITSAPGLQLATTSYGIINIGAAAYFVGSMGVAGASNLFECGKLWEAANRLSQNKGDSRLINSYAGEGWKRCLEGGVDLSFALLGGSKMTLEGLKAYRHKNEVPSASEEHKTDTPLERLTKENLEELTGSAEANQGSNVARAKTEVEERIIDELRRLLRETAPNDASMRDYISQEIQELTEVVRAARQREIDEWSELLREEQADDAKAIISEELKRLKAEAAIGSIEPKTTSRIAAPASGVAVAADLPPDIPPTPSLGNWKYRPLSLWERFQKWRWSRKRVGNLAEAYVALQTSNYNAGSPAWQQGVWELVEAYRQAKTLAIIRGGDKRVDYGARRGAFRGLVNGADRLLDVLETRWLKDLERATQSLSDAEGTMEGLSRKPYPCVEAWRHSLDEGARDGWRFLRRSEKPLKEPKKGTVYVPEEARATFEADLSDARRAAEVIGNYKRLEAEVFDRLYAVTRHRLFVELILEEMAPKTTLVEKIKSEGRGPTPEEQARIDSLSDELSQGEIAYFNVIRGRIEGFFQELKQGDPETPRYGRYVRDFVFNIADKVRYDAEVEYGKPDPRWIGRMAILHYDFVVQGLESLAQRLPQFRWVDSLCKVLKQIRVELTRGEVAKLLESMNEELTLELSRGGEHDLVRIRIADGLSGAVDELRGQIEAKEAEIAQLKEVSPRRPKVISEKEGELSKLQRQVIGGYETGRQSALKQLQGLSNMQPQQLVETILAESKLRIDFLKKILMTVIMHKRGLTGFDPTSAANAGTRQAKREQGAGVQAEFERVMEFLRENPDLTLNGVPMKELLDSIEGWNASLEHIVTYQTAGGWKGRVERGFYIKLIHSVVGICLAIRGYSALSSDGDSGALQMIEEIISEILVKNKRKWLDIKQNISEEELGDHLDDIQTDFKKAIDVYVWDGRLDEQQVTMVQTELSRRVYEELLRKLLIGQALNGAIEATDDSSGGK